MCFYVPTCVSIKGFLKGKESWLMHHRMSLSSVSEAAINRTPARFKQRKDKTILQAGLDLQASELNIALKVKRIIAKKIMLPLLCSALWTFAGFCSVEDAENPGGRRTWTKASKLGRTAMCFWCGGEKGVVLK